MVFRMFLAASLLLSSCTAVTTVSSGGFRWGRNFVTGEIPRATRAVAGGIGRLFGGGDDSFWYADEMRGSPSIVVNLGEQMAYLYKGGELAGGSPISSGAEGYDTRPGRYRIIEKDIDHKSSIYGDYEDAYGNVIMTEIDNRKDRRPPGTRFEGAKMFFFMRIYGGVGMHQGYLPGYPASHGCIRMPGHMAEKFYRSVRVGTPVRIVP